MLYLQELVFLEVLDTASFPFYFINWKHADILCCFMFEIAATFWFPIHICNFTGDGIWYRHIQNCISLPWRSFYSAQVLFYLNFSVLFISYDLCNNFLFSVIITINSCLSFQGIIKAWGSNWNGDMHGDYGSTLWRRHHFSSFYYLLRLSCCCDTGMHPLRLVVLFSIYRFN